MDPHLDFERGVSAGIYSHEHLMCKLPVEGRRWSHYDRNASCVNANFAQLCSRRRRGRLFMQCVDIFHIKEREPSSSFRIFRKIMGINTLLPFVKEATTKMNIKDFAGPESRAKDANLIGIFLIFYKRGGGGYSFKNKNTFCSISRGGELPWHEKV